MREYLAASLMAAVVGSTTCTAVAAHEGWFVRVCPTKTESLRINLAFYVTPMSVSGSVIISSSVWNSTIMRITR